MILTDKDIYHIHTFRCCHAEEVPDEAYIQEAIDLGANAIWFTDHAPFPKDPFMDRMKYEQLDEYLSTLYALKIKYRNIINVHIGLEVEYFRSFDESGYYRELKSDGRIETLLLGQHMFEETDRPYSYSFSWTDDRLDKEEYRGLCEAICGGIQSGYFDGVAHPDRIFRRCSTWTRSMTAAAEKIIKSAHRHQMFLELNMHSVMQEKHFWPQFWDIAKNTADIVIGLDAHSVKEMQERKEASIHWKKYF